MKTLIASATVCAAVLSLSVCSPAAAKIIVDLTGNNTTADASGNGNNGTWNGTPSYAPIGGTTGFNLDGTNNVYVPSSSSLNIPTNSIVTVSALVDPTSAHLSTERIIDKITVGTADGYLVDILNDKFRVIMGGVAVYGAKSVIAGTTYQVDAVYDGLLATPTVDLFVNGALDGSTTAGAFVDNSANNLRIGVDSNGANNFSGVIANAEITASVPEPATWAMMGLGFAAVGYAGLRRSSKSRAAIA
jgi:hypothetical protein